MFSPKILPFTYRKGVTWKGRRYVFRKRMINFPSLVAPDIVGVQPMDISDELLTFKIRRVYA